jgi:hypothetical protein
MFWASERKKKLPDYRIIIFYLLLIFLFIGADPELYLKKKGSVWLDQHQKEK